MRRNIRTGSRRDSFVLIIYKNTLAPIVGDSADRRRIVPARAGPALIGAGAQEAARASSSRSRASHNRPWEEIGLARDEEWEVARASGREAHDQHVVGLGFRALQVAQRLRDDRVAYLVAQDVKRGAASRAVSLEPS